MIHVCEPICWGFEHVPFNSAALSIIRLSYPEERISFYGEADHLRLVRDQEKGGLSRSIEWNDILIPERHAEFTSRISMDFRLAKKLFKRRNSQSFHVFLSTSPSLLISIKLLSATYGGLIAQLFLHGGLSSLKGPHSRNPLIRARHLRFALSLPPNSHLQYFVMEDPIKHRLIQEIPRIARNVQVMNHPVPPNEGMDGPMNFAPPFRFGFLGLASEAKGYPAFLRTAEIITEQFSEEAEFHAIGTLDKDSQMTEFGGTSLSTTPRRDPLGREEFRQQLSRLHYVCLPYAPEHYELSPSGVLLDAIAWEKPVIATKMPILEQLFSKFGPFGYLCSSEKEFCDRIQQIVAQKNGTEYEANVSALKRVKRARSPRHLAPGYRDICNQIRRPGNQEPGH